MTLLAGATAYDSRDYLRAQAYNNAVANHRLLGACAQLDADDLNRKRVSFFPTIVHTWNHILTVDWYYISALEGHSVGPGAFEPEIPFPEFDTFEPEQRAADQRLIAVCEDLDEKALSKTIEMVRANRIQEDRVDRTLLHLFGHQIHHRDQIHAMLSGTDVAPPQLDEFFLGDAVEQNFRAADFTALGFDEALIWRDL